MTGCGLEKKIGADHLQSAVVRTILDCRHVETMGDRTWLLQLCTLWPLDACQLGSSHDGLDGNHDQSPVHHRRAPLSAVSCMGQLYHRHGWVHRELSRRHHGCAQVSSCGATIEPGRQTIISPLIFISPAASPPFPTELSLRSSRRSSMQLAAGSPRPGLGQP
jgi:hypothetical protein